MVIQLLNFYLEGERRNAMWRQQWGKAWPDRPEAVTDLGGRRSSGLWEDFFIKQLI